jgi:hypothetical protein
MALDLELMAIADDGTLEAWVDRFPGEGENLQFLRLYFSGERGSREEDSLPDRELTKVVLEMARQHPEIEERRLTIGRSWDVMHFVLSPDRRRGIASTGDPGTLALRGSRDFHPMVRATQGSPLRFLAASDVPGVLEFLTSVTPGEIEHRLREATRPGTSVYKFGPEDPGSWQTRVKDALGSLVQFYEAVWDREEAVLSVLD